MAFLTGLSLGLLFVDLSTAFASVVRALALPTDASDVEWRRRLMDSGFTDSEASGIMQEVHDEDLWAQSGGCTHLQTLLKELHIDTWASNEGLAGVIRCESGTLAGTPTADFVFILAFARVLQKARIELQTAGLIHNVDTEGAAQYFGESELHGQTLGMQDADYMDDTVFPIVAPARKLVDAVVAAAVIISDTFAQYGFKVNFGSGKTEAVLIFRGAGAIKEQRRLAQTGNAATLSTRAGSRELRFVASYKHLGSKITNTAEILPEIKARMAVMKAALLPLRKQVLQCHAVAPENCATIATGSLLSKGAFQTSAWPSPYIPRSSWYSIPA